MKLYRVKVCYEGSVDYEIEADSPKEAEDLALDKFTEDVADDSIFLLDTLNYDSDVISVTREE